MDTRLKQIFNKISLIVQEKQENVLNIISYKEKQIKNHRKILLQMDVAKWWMATNKMLVCGATSTLTLVGRNVNDTSFAGVLEVFDNKTEISIMTQNIYSLLSSQEKWKHTSIQKACRRMFAATLFMIAKYTQMSMNKTMNEQSVI